MRSIILTPDFVDTQACSALITAFGKARPMRTENGFFDEMIVYLQAIEDSRIRQLMCATCDRILKILKEHYKIRELYADALMLCQWPVGKEMPPHVDNQATHYYSTPWRTHSAILYLNDVDQGGELCFTKFNLDVKPRRGLLVAFPSDARHEHGVRRLRNGRRYTMPCWFTDDAKRQMPAAICQTTPKSR